MSNFRRVTVSLPADLVEKLDRLSALCHISRSAFVTELLGESVEALDLALGVMKAPDPENVRRYRGDSIALVEQKVAELKRLLDDDLFSGVHND